ncbi:ADP-forming succinate--CoA ligase subunit beta [Verrucomicrobia bacterium]|jgi:succinyl-CoA synthetase beta subunit|nr:ADP-forming succinate--CoA ligase subunit beta [Verrucomicrobiota bacterium]MDA7667474.1 ADP-forming succinate--CoA ligase subunit beta [bacterium]MDB4798199.1 ADP-forming succinate--CoA ligase subunit beta [Verrucomicrobiota bacterium]
MNIHEYQAKQLLAKYGVNVPAGDPCTSVADARAIGDRLFNDGTELAVIKAQIHAGGRGKGTFKSGFQGGVHLCRSAQDVEDKAKAMLGEVLVTKQTGEAGRQVNTVLIASAEKIVKEFYLAVLLDRETAKPVVMASTEGGMDIEEVAEKNPEKIIRVSIDPALGMMPYQARQIAVGLQVPSKLIGATAKLVQNVYQTSWSCDASLVEINPLCLVEDSDGNQDICAVDAKISIDDNALYRHKDVVAMRDLGEEAPLEIEASKFDLNYIKLDGSIACLVNGAGLAMATMDIIQHFGGSPANFLDVGGGASTEQVTAAFRIILSDPNVKGILVNIFGGIMQCDVIAQGIVAAARETQLSLPLVVRLEGNNVDLGKKILDESGLTIISGDTMADGAQKIVDAVEKSA